MIARDHLRAFVQRIEKLDEELDAINGDKKETYAEAKSNGFDVKALKEVIRQRRKDPAALSEFEAIVDLYKHALGMIPDDGTDDATRAGAREDEDDDEDQDQAAVPPAVSPEPAGRSAEQAPASNVVKLAPPAAPNDFPDIPEALRRC